MFPPLVAGADTLPRSWPLISPFPTGAGEDQATSGLQLPRCPRDCGARTVQVQGQVHV